MECEYAYVYQTSEGVSSGSTPSTRQGEIMARRTIGVIMNGVTGRMGAHQHLARSIVAIREQGGVRLPHGEVVMPDPILVGRNEHKLRRLAEEHQIERWSTDLERCLANPADTVYFDAQVTARRAESVRAAIRAGKHIYCEKPTATDLATALELARLAERAGVKHGVVQDKLFLPGLIKLKRLVTSGYFGRILSVRGEFGYWVFEDAGGIIAQINSSWAVRVYRDELFMLQVDGTAGSAVAGLRECKTQPRVNTPRAVWNPDLPNPLRFRDSWLDVPTWESPDNAFKAQWELFLKHVACNEPFPWSLLEGAKGVQLAELGLRSWRERRWLDVPDLSIG